LKKIITNIKLLVNDVVVFFIVVTFNKRIPTHFSIKKTIEGTRASSGEKSHITSKLEVVFYFHITL